jgi:succinate dehydrogenase / fumarate reductase cytochrome b subunit
MNRLVRLFGASVGRKLTVAATGVVLLGFLLGHLFGNLKVFQGPDALNSYAAWLRGHPLLWVFRLGLLAVFVVHIYATLSLARENRAARPVKYQRYRPLAATLPSRSMALSGLIVLAFVLYHLLHFTFGVIDFEHVRLLDVEERPDVYAMMVGSFRNPWISTSYVVAIVLMGLHLVHGTVSGFQTFGVHHESYETLIRVTCMVLVLAIVAGFCSIPVLIYLGKVTLSGGT